MRVWHGVTPEEKGDAYYAYILETGVKFYRSQKGNRGQFVLRRDREGKADFLLLSLWDSREAIRAFAGPDIDKAVYLFSRDAEFLLELEPDVRHYEVLTGPSIERKLSCGLFHPV